MDHTPGFLKIVEASSGKVRHTDIAGAIARVQADPRALLIDVREDDEFRAGHVAGAIHIGKGVIERDIERMVPDPDTELLLYCGGGFRSVLAADALGQMGYTNVTSIDGGYRAFVEAGTPIGRTV